MRLLDRVAVVTGGGSGIGRATALALAAEGALVVVGDVDEEAADATAALVRAGGGLADVRGVDVRESPQVDALVDAAAARHGRLDLVVNNAGITRFRPLLEQTPADYDDVVRVNQYGSYHGILAAARRMRALGTPGVIVNVGSVLADLPTAGNLAYAASKAAIVAMTRAAALELAPLGIRVVAVSPGATDTPLLRPLRDAGLTRHSARRHLRNRLLRPEQVAAVVVFLATDAADAINGVVVPVDDGYGSFK